MHMCVNVRIHLYVGVFCMYMYVLYGRCVYNYMWVYVYLYVDMYVMLEL